MAAGIYKVCKSSEIVILAADFGNLITGRKSGSYKNRIKNTIQKRTQPEAGVLFFYKNKTDMPQSAADRRKNEQ